MTPAQKLIERVLSEGFEDKMKSLSTSHGGYKPEKKEGGVLIGFDSVKDAEKFTDALNAEYDYAMKGTKVFVSSDDDIPYPYSEW